MGAPLRPGPRARGAERARARGGEPAAGAPAAPAPRARALEAASTRRRGRGTLAAAMAHRILIFVGAAPAPPRLLRRRRRRSPRPTSTGRSPRCWSRATRCTSAARSPSAGTAAGPLVARRARRPRRAHASRLQRRGRRLKVRARARARTAPAAGTRAGRSSASTGGSAAGSCTCCADGDGRSRRSTRRSGTVDGAGPPRAPRCGSAASDLRAVDAATGAASRRRGRPRCSTTSPWPATAVRRRPVGLPARLDAAERLALGASPARCTDLDVRDGVVYAAGPPGAVARARDGGEIVRYRGDEPASTIAAGAGRGRGARAAGSRRFDAVDGRRPRVVRRRRGGALGRRRRASARRDAGGHRRSAGGLQRRGSAVRAELGAIAIAGTRLYVAGRTRFALLRPARRLARAVVAAAARRPVHALAAANGVVAIGGDAGRPRRRRARATSPRSTCGPARSRRSRRRGRRSRLPRCTRSAACSTPAAPAGSPPLDRADGRAAAVPGGERPGPRPRRAPATRCTSAARPGTLGGAPHRRTRRRRRSRRARCCRSLPPSSCDVDALAVSRRHAARRRLLRAAQLPGPRADTPVPQRRRARAGAARGRRGRRCGRAGRFAGGNVAHFAADGDAAGRLAR